MKVEVMFATKKWNVEINLFFPWHSYLEYKLLRVGALKYLVQSLIGVGTSKSMLCSHSPASGEGWSWASWSNE